MACLSLTVSALPHITLNAAPTARLTLSVEHICTVSTDTLVVLAASDGVLRTKNGGYILLNPATNPQQ